MAAESGRHLPRRCCSSATSTSAFATVGESDPSGDEKFFALSRQAKCIPIVATQSISSLKSTLPGESWRTLLQTFRTKVFLCLIGRLQRQGGERPVRAGRTDDAQLVDFRESGHDVRVGMLSGQALAHKAGLTINKSYNLQWRPVFEAKRFMELQNAQAIVLAYDGAESAAGAALLSEAVLPGSESVVLRPTGAGTEI